MKLNRYSIKNSFNKRINNIRIDIFFVSWRLFESREQKK